MFDFKKIIQTTNQAFDAKVLEMVKDKVDGALRDKGLPTYSTVSNIHKEAYERVLSNANLGNNLVPEGATAAGANPSKNSNRKEAVFTPGSENAAKGTNTAQKEISYKSTDDPKTSAALLRYPLPGDKYERAPFMAIEGFKYRYDRSDVAGNMRARKGQNENNKNTSTKKAVGINRTAYIRLPLPGNLASGLSSNFEDYSSVFAKLLKSNNGVTPSGDGIRDQLSSLISDDPNFIHDLTSIGLIAGLFTGASTGSATEGFTAALDESLKFIRINGGFTVNPMQQTSYIGSNMRTHSFEFNMIPRNKKEALECKKIIETLQYCSIGEKRSEIGGILINFPSVWNISFHNYDGSMVNGILRIPDSFLESVNVTYSPSRAGFTVTEDGDPFAYVLNLTFKECQNLVRNDLAYLIQGGQSLDNPIVDPASITSTINISPDSDTTNTSVSEQNGGSGGGTTGQNARQPWDNPSPSTPQIPISP